MPREPSELMGRVWSLLRRRTTTGTFIPEIDGLRFLAISGVMLYHLLLHVGAWMSFDAGQSVPLGALADVMVRGTHGVELFFVISGFILGLPFARYHLQDSQPVSLKRYYLRRLTRLEPPYILALLASSAVVLITTFSTVRSLLPHVSSSLLYLHWLAFNNHNPASSVLWSLEVEVQFYMLAPVLALIFRIREKRPRRLALILLILVSLVLFPRFLRFDRSFTLVGYLHFFAIGFLLADFYLLDWIRPSRISILWDVVFIASLTTFAFAPGAEAHTAMLLCFAALIVAAFRGHFVPRALRMPLITTIGGMCYSIYLLHETVLGPIVHRTVHLTPNLPLATEYFLQIPLAGIPMLLILTCYYLLIERPCMDPSWPGKLMKAIRGRIGSAGGVPASEGSGSRTI